MPIINPLAGTGVTQYIDGTAVSAGGFTGTVAMGWNGTDLVGLRTDGSDNLLVVVSGTVASTQSGTWTVNSPVSSTASSPAATSVTSTSSSILATNAARKEVLIVNTDVVVVYIAMGQTPTATAYHVALSPCTTANDGTGGSYVSDIWTGAINAITASTSGHVVVTELT